MVVVVVVVEGLQVVLIPMRRGKTVGLMNVAGSHCLQGELECRDHLDSLGLAGCTALHRKFQVCYFLLALVAFAVVVVAVVEAVDMLLDRQP